MLSTPLFSLGSTIPSVFPHILTYFCLPINVIWVDDDTLYRCAVLLQRILMIYIRRQICKNLIDSILVCANCVYFLHSQQIKTKTNIQQFLGHTLLNVECRMLTHAQQQQQTVWCSSAKQSKAKKKSQLLRVFNFIQSIFSIIQIFEFVRCALLIFFAKKNQKRKSNSLDFVYACTAMTATAHNIFFYPFLYHLDFRVIISNHLLKSQQFWCHCRVVCVCVRRAYENIAFSVYLFI